MNGEAIASFRGDMSNLPDRHERDPTQEHFASDRERIYRRSWLPLIDTEDVTEKGSYFVYDLPTLIPLFSS
jgi:hypothetical protein